MRARVLAAALALALDFLFGDPEGRWHPVCFIGRYISFAEKALRKRCSNLEWAGIVLTASTLALAMLAAGLLALPLLVLPEPAGIVYRALLLWPGLAARTMVQEARGVQRALETGLDAGRRHLSRIVGRDTAQLSREEVICAAVETVAENTTDGVTSPILYALLGGPILLWGFKAASTLDSMVGYLDEHYRRIGRCSARLDDVLNFVPARLTGPAMALSAFVCGLDAENAFRILARDHANHLSPNCAWTEAAAAGALHIRLGGTHTYFGKPVEKPAIGDGDRCPEGADIERACRLLICTSVLFLLALGVPMFFFGG